MSSYLVFARKYRPQLFKEILAQEAIVKILSNAIKRGRVGHAYMFCGPHGTGKTSAARIFSKALNCSSMQDEPCDKCPSCKEISQGCSLDVMEIDGASHRGIEDIRRINDTIGYAPTTGKYRIYLIDEVHMLTKEAFNALLKTLEEPPPHVKFFLATTEPHLVPTTILSRCQRLNFKPIPQEQMVEKLALIARDLGREVEREALVLLTRFAHGGLRDAESFFDELLLYEEGAIARRHVEELFGLVSQELFATLDAAGPKGDYTLAFTLVDRLFTEGKNLPFFLEELTQHFRRHLHNLSFGFNCLKFKEHFDEAWQKPSEAIARGTIASEVATRFCQDSQNAFEDQIVKPKTQVHKPTLYRLEQCVEILELLGSAPQEMSRAPSKRTFLQILLLRILHSHKKVSLESLVTRLEELEKGAPLLPSPLEIPSAAAYMPPLAEAPPPVTQTIDNQPITQETDTKTDSKARQETVMRFAAKELNGNLKMKE